MRHSALISAAVLALPESYSTPRCLAGVDIGEGHEAEQGPMIMDGMMARVSRGVADFHPPGVTSMAGVKASEEGIMAGEYFPSSEM